MKECFYTGTCVEFDGDKLWYIGATERKELPINEYSLAALYQNMYQDGRGVLDANDRLIVQDIIDRAMVIKQVDPITTQIVNTAVASVAKQYDKMKLYILIREDISIGHSINCAAHAACAAALKWKDDSDFINWEKHSFRKVTCKVSRKMFEESKQFSDHIIISEDAINDTEVAIIFKPREVWPDFFTRPRLFT